MRLHKSIINLSWEFINLCFVHLEYRTDFVIRSSTSPVQMVGQEAPPQYMQDQAAFPATKWRNWPYFMGKHYFMMGKPTGWVLYGFFFIVRGISILSTSFFAGDRFRIWPYFLAKSGNITGQPLEMMVYGEASFAQVFFCVKCNELIDSCLSLIDFLDVFPSSCHYMSLMSPWWFQSSLKCTTGRVDRKSHSRHQAPILYDGNSWDINYLRATVAIQSVCRMTAA